MLPTFRFLKIFIAVILNSLSDDLITVPSLHLGLMIGLSLQTGSFSAFEMYYFLLKARHVVRW